MLNFRLLAGVAVAFALVSSTIAGPSEAVPAVTARAEHFNPVGLRLAPMNNTVAPAKRMTNAERLARGLTPNPPHRRAPGQLRARQSATPTSDSAAPTSSDLPSSASSSASDSATPASSSPSAAPACSTYNGYIKARYSSPTGQYTDGYVTNTLNSHGEWGFTHAPSQALAVSFELCTADAGAPVTLLSTNADTAYPYLAAITGFANTGDRDTLSAGSRNYAYIGGTGSDVPYGVDPQPQANSFSTAAGSSEDVETANWTIDPATGAVSAEWYNADGSAPATTLVYVPSAAAWAIVGDLNVFANNFGTAYRATWTFITALPAAS
ncbi:hypothetical protein PHLGIDRAFT_33551 [Phlebiopsis gigantea 11061_1 CR5-6]|uniref:Uncharacterized protein n=1 Tax=Phlebiopsis gigantea (strain 11061_1 CR5-6) TaxID=745531 RepID=A0A0C3SCU1_PHLG1|nr:hypothetical protein PHLGIDRAFT_33551 [Phlebiopsis gigantea 11061_1 CR5-6]